MKKVNEQFKINKNTMRDLTPEEQNHVAGGTVGTVTTHLWTITTAPTQTGTATSPQCGTNNGQML